ncbi:MAG: cell division protein FtsZ [Bacteroidota bacterium]|nr:cell division protein FtsZ [Bacteroidota bacterium]
MSDQHLEEGYSFDLPKNRSSVIKVIGVGGGGSNAVNHMKEMGIKGVDFIVCNTDSQALEHSPVENKVQLGVNLTEGLGAGANPEVGQQAAMESIEEIKDILSKNTKMLFITAGMGGGTGTGAAPVIAKVAQDMGILTVGIVTHPFKFEGSIRQKQAEQGIEQLRKFVDSLIVINNNKLREVYGNLGFKAGFAKADEVLAIAAKGIAEVITHHYTTNIDLKDAKTVLARSGTAIMGSGAADGENRAQDAIRAALDSPLLNDNHIYGAKNVLLLIVSGVDENEITIDEIGEITDFIQNEAGGDANVIMGIGQDDELSNKIAVTIIATGFPADQQVKVINKEPQRIVHPLEPEQPVNVEVYEKPLNEVKPTSETPEREERKKTYQPNLFEEPQPQKEDAPDPEEPQAIKEDKGGQAHEPEFLIFDLEDEEPDSVTEEEISDSAEETTDPFELPIESTFTLDQEEPSEEPMADMEEEMPSQEETPEPPVVKNEPVEEPIKRYSLEDLDQLEEQLMGNKARENRERREASRQTPSSPTPSSNQPDVEEDDDSLKMFVKEKPRAEELQRGESQGDAFDQPINESMKRRAEERMERLKAFQHNFKHLQNNIQDSENIPAYKRMGIELDQSKASSQSKVSRMTLSDDDEPQLRSNNSFLHDNVD